MRVSTPGQQQREQELVPGEDQAEDGGRGEAGDDLRQADLEEHPDLGRAVDPRGVLDVGRQLVEEALHHPDGERQVEGGVEQDDAGIGAGRPVTRNIRKIGMMTTIAGSMRVVRMMNR